jgi:hypothetical protein
MKSIVERHRLNPRLGPRRGRTSKVFLLPFAYASSVIPRLATQQPMNDVFTNVALGISLDLTDSHADINSLRYYRARRFEP